MKYVLAGCVVALSMGTAAMASDQLARQLGVEPGAYTLAQLTEIKAARDHDDHLRLKRAMQQSDVVVSTQSIGPGARMNEQLAWSMGVDPTGYSNAELALMFFDRND